MSSACLPWLPDGLPSMNPIILINGLWGKPITIICIYTMRKTPKKIKILKEIKEMCGWS
jgi:hypothetical protein